MAKDENKESEIRGDEQEIVDQRLPVWRPQDADREYYRYETKKRIQHYTVPPQTIFRPAKPTPTIRDAEHKRVAVYARVSTKSKEQVSSIENQTKYYTEKIAKTPNWDLAEIYSDEGKSGTSKKWRPEFKRMLEDASKKKMDLIVCASVSRFARNISDLIEEVRKLRTTNPSNPVGVYFETEDLYTLDPNINERLQMQGLFAEWESGNKSRRMILRSCNATNPNAVLWDETKKSGLQLCTSAFSNAVYDKLDWMRKYKFRFRGVTRVRGGERIIFFFLDEPQILVGKDKKNLDAMDTSDSTVKYIPYKESECGEAAGLTAGIAYPENWQEQVGVSYEIKQQRGRVLDAVSSADIRNHGTKVVNPFIGVIPTHGELEDELEQIYEAM